jgi:hypothetical protein
VVDFNFLPIKVGEVGLVFGKIRFSHEIIPGTEVAYHVIISPPAPPTPPTPPKE